MTAPLRSAGTAIVLDDEAAARDAGAAVLRECGMPVVVATASGAQALDLVATGSVALVVCDLAMPRMDGVQFIERLSGIAPRTPLVLVSGTNDKVLKLVEGLAQELGLNLVGAFKKPLLASDVRRILARNDVTPRQGRGPAPKIGPDEVREGIERYEFEVFYQPIVQMAGGVLLGVEALPRWHHPGHGLLGADHFIPVAEKSGDIVALTRYVARHAIMQLGSWSRIRATPALPPTVSINISPYGVGPAGFPDELAGIATTAGLVPGQVTLELTETAITKSPEIVRFVSRVRLCGFSLAIDDFGTGHSGLEQLRRLPFTTLKIDKTFVTGTAGDRDARAIVEAGIRLAHQLGLRAVAEGVESLEDWAMLDSLGCDAAQGFWISAPIPATQIGDWLTRWSRIRRF